MVTVHVLVVDDHPLIHETLGLAVRAVLPKARISDAFSLTGALEAARSLPEDALVLLDLGLPDGNGIDVLRTFRKAYPNLRVVVVSATETSVLVAAALKAGAAGYIPKTSTPDMIVAALGVIAAGGTYIPKQVMPEVGIAPVFTARQLEVLQLLAKGASNRDIARTLGIADNTAKQHTHAVFQVLNVTSRSQAVVAAVRLGIDLS
jgi:DNA-binding NarL/FixJ family response regulator